MRPARRYPLAWLLAGTLLGACGTDIAAPEVELQAARAEDTPRFSDWSAPVNLGPVINSDVTDLDVTVSRDGLSLYFSSNRAGGFGGFDIWVARRAAVDEPWGVPQNLGPTINTDANEQGPHLTRDGHRLFLFSNRVGGFGGNDIYLARRRSERDDFGWRTPQNLGGGVNSAANDNLPHYVEHDGDAGALYFNSNRDGGMGGTDIYASTVNSEGTFGSAELVPELNSPAQDASLVIHRDGLEALLTSTRSGTLGRFDVWVTTRSSASAPWTVPVNAGTSINTTADESRLALSFDATELYLISDRPGTLGLLDIWVARRTRLR